MGVFLRALILATLAGSAAAQAQPAPPPATTPATTAPSTQRVIAVSIPSATTLPASPGFFTIKTKVTVGERHFQMTVGLFLPPGYFQDTKPFPIVMMLHNRGGEGTNGNIMAEGLAALCSRDDWDGRALSAAPGEPKPPAPMANAINLRTQAQFVGIAPQCPRGYAFSRGPMPAVLGALVDLVEKQYRTDPDRVYLTGFSYGGTCTWQIAEQIPQRFAAIAAISTRSTDNPAKTAQALKNMGVYVACGTNDWSPAFCQMMRDALTAAGHQDFVYRQIEDGTHWCYPTVYTDPQFWDWLLAHRRSHAGAATRP